MAFDYSTLKINDMVEVVIDVVRDPNTGTILMNDLHPANVVKVYCDGADIVLNSPSLGQRLLEWCVHKDDNRCKQIGPMEERIKESRDDLNGTPGTGIFQLSRNQKILVGLDDRLAAQERLLNDLTIRLARLEENKPRVKKADKQARSAADARDLPEPAMAGK